MLDLIRNTERAGDAAETLFDDCVEGIAVIIEIVCAAENGRGQEALHLSGKRSVGIADVCALRPDGNHAGEGCRTAVVIMLCRDECGYSRKIDFLSTDDPGNVPEVAVPDMRIGGGE